jgi:predicted transcriptional regulator
MEKRYLSPEDAAPFLGLSAAAVRKYMRNGSMDLGYQKELIELRLK